MAYTHLRPGIIRPVQNEVSPWHAADWVPLGAPVLAYLAEWLPAAMTTTRALGKAMLALSRREASLPDHLENAEINAFDD